MIALSQQSERKMSVRERVDAVCDQMSASNGYAYAAGYFSSALSNALEMLSEDSREKFLSVMEK